jgi:membrane dipeptidase
VTTSDRISALLREHGIVDGHNDLLWAARDKVAYDFDRLELTDSAVCQAIGTHTDLPRLRAGGVGAQFWSVYVPATLSGDAAVTATLEQIDAGHTMITRYADQLALATTVEDVDRAWEQGRIASLMGAEGGHQINESLGTLRMLHRLGVRYLTLTHNDNVPWADSATDEPVLGGLSDFGREVVAEMNRIGMLVDLSHVSADVMRQALDVSSVPVIFSHSSARAVCDHPRNAPDDVLARLAGNGGVCMVTFVPKFVNQEVCDWTAEGKAAAAAEGIATDDADAEDAFLERYRRVHPAPVATLADVVTHVEHVRDVAGVDHIGLGGDYDGVGELPTGLEDVSTYPRLLEALAERGWSDEDLARLTRRNVLRAMGDAGLTAAGEAGQNPTGPA